MSQRKIPHYFSSNKDENAVRTRGGLPPALYEEVINLGSPPSGTRRPLTIVQRARLQRSLTVQRSHVRHLTEDLEYVADSLAEVNPRSQQRHRQQEQHNRLVSRLAEANDVIGRLTHLIERDDDDRDFFLAHKVQREEVADFEARQQACRSQAVPLKPRPQEPCTSAQARERQRAVKRPISEEQRTDVQPQAAPSPLVIPESPILPPNTPVGSRRAKSRLQRTLTPSLRRWTRSATSKSSSSSDTAITSKLSKRNKKLYTKLNDRIETEAAAEHEAAADGPRMPSRSRAPPRVTFASSPILGEQPHHQQSVVQQQQHQQQREPQQQQDRQPRRQRQTSASYGNGLEARLRYFERSTLNRPVAREYQLVCDHNCAFFNDNGHCEHAVVNVSGTVAVNCPYLCYDFYVTSRCGHLQVDLGEGFKDVHARPQPTNVVQPDIAQIGRYFRDASEARTPVRRPTLTPEEAAREANRDTQPEVKPEIKQETEVEGQEIKKEE